MEPLLSLIKNNSLTKLMGLCCKDINAVQYYRKVH